MSSPTPAWIAAPFRAAHRSQTWCHVLRACALSRWAEAHGYAPVCVHPAIWHNAYGDDADPTARERGLQVDEVLVQAIAWRNGKLLVLLRDDGSVSEGMRREIHAFVGIAAMLTPHPDRCILKHTWAEWNLIFAS